MSESKGIPIRHIRLNHLSELPNDYGTTPGGTLYSTTPGGTRIIYDRSFLLKCRSSPMANTPPSNLPDIPGVTSPDKSPNRQITKIVEEKEVTNGKDKPKENGGILPNWSMHGPHIPAFHPCPANGPLQQYRQRSLQQQRQAMLDKALDPNLVYTISGPVGQNVNPMVPPDYISYPPPPQSPQAQFYDSNNNLQNNAGDGLWQMNGMPMLPQSNKPYPMSQLTSWRRMKVNQAITHAFTQSNQPFPNASQSQGAAVNFAMRGRGRGVPLQHTSVENLCEPIQQLFMSQFAQQAYPVCPAYGHLPCYSDKSKVVDENSNIVPYPQG